MTTPADPGRAADLRVLSVNVGSSSLRIDLWVVPSARPDAMLVAQGIGSERGTIVSSIGGGKTEEDEATLPDHRAALQTLLTRLSGPLDVERIGHRVVHGGAVYREPVWVDEQVLTALDAVAALVPLHLPAALGVIRDLRERYPRILQAAVFDTAFHATLPQRAVEYAVPAEWRAWGVRRYGFHGLACADAVFQLGGRLRERAVLLHLGAGCSATALLRGKSVDTTMGLTPLEGLVMGTRSGDVDPGILVYLQREHGLSARQIDGALNHESGLLGLSHLSSDMKTLLGRMATPQVALAIEVFCYRAAKAAGALAVALGGCDQIIFTGGIGEHAAPIRARVLRHLEFLGVRADDGANEADAPIVSAPDSAITVHVVRVDEGRQIAREVARLRDERPPRQ